MLTQIKLTNFKCFKEETAIPLSQFNLFTGVNGAGKSTALQPLLLMRQSIEHNPYTTELILNGSCVNLGSFDDVRNCETPKENPIFLEFLYSDDKDKFSMCYHLESKANEMSLSIAKIDMCLKQFYRSKYGKKIDIFFNTFFYNKLLKEYENKFHVETPLFKLNEPTEEVLFSLEPTTKDSNKGGGYSINMNFTKLTSIEDIHFISADRIGPQEIYQKSMLPNFPHVGTKGEFAVNLLDKMAQELVNEKLCLGENARTLITQTEEWIGRILNPLSLEVKPLRANYLELLMGGFKPSNVGFGYSCILPIIVTGLIAKPSEKIIIENPEIHLHPKAQSALIDFLIKVSNTGVQVFIESHSDHILNALRVATKEKKLNPEDSSILFFNQNKNKENEITSILIDDKGKLHKKTEEGTVAKIPQGFFDEWTNSMAKLF